MSLQAAIGRVAELNSLLGGIAPAAQAAAPAATAAGATARAASATGSPTGSQATFASLLQGALAPAATSPAAPVVASGGVGARMVALAQAEVGQAESAPGSNNSARIAQYRTATAGSMVAPWCGYFVSWLGRQAGAPVGDRGEGLGSVDAIWAWGERTGRAVRAAPGAARPGDLIVWDEHVGIVERVLPDGRIQTIEGNSSNAVSRRVHAVSDHIGYVRMG